MSPDSPLAYAKTAREELDGKLGTQEPLVKNALTPKRLHHYTDASGLKGILQTRKLHATDLRFMNDSGELQYARDLISKVANSELSECDKAVSEFFHQGLGVLGQLDELRFYAACFCEDGDLLGQWRAYGNSGGGYAIGFDVPAMMSNLFLGDVPQLGNRTLQKVDYDPESQQKSVRRVLKGPVSISNDCLNKFRNHPDLVDALRACVSHTVKSLVREQSRIKHPLFREEREWRIVEIEREAKAFRISRAGLLVPFIELPLGGSPRRSTFVAELRWGPTLTPELAKLSLETLAESFGYQGLTIQGSLIPLRT
jgi:hypothetical protein